MAKQSPVEITRGSVTVRIYRTPGKRRRAERKRADRFTLVWWEGPRRHRKTFQRGKAFGRAKTQAESIANKLSRGEAEALKLTSADRHAYVRARAALKSFKVELDTAALEYAAARKILGAASLIEAAREFAKRHSATMPKRTVKEVFDEMMEDKARRKLSALYLADLKLRCGRFSEAFAVPIASVTAGDVRTFLDSLKVQPRTHNNFLNAIGTLFKFAKARSYLPRDHDDLAGIEAVKEDAGIIDIFTPAEMARLLNAAPKDFLPALAISAFAGLRSAEVERLEWKCVRLAERFIEVTAAKAKTASRRLAPVPDNLAQWLGPYANEQGRVWPHGHAYFYEIQKETAARTKAKKLAPVEWKHNALRHSFISYRLAATQNANQVALEAGNSPQMIFAHYRELVTPADAKTWFGLAPVAPENVTQMPRQTANAYAHADRA